MCFLFTHSLLLIPPALLMILHTMEKIKITTTKRSRQFTRLCLKKLTEDEKVFKLQGLSMEI